MTTTTAVAAAASTPVTSNNSTGGGGGKARRKNRRRGGKSRNSNNRDGDASSSTPKGPPQSPQIKMTLRNIGKVEKYGHVAALMDLLHQLVDKANERLHVDQRMLLHEASMNKLVQDEQAAVEARRVWENEQKQQDAEVAPNATTSKENGNTEEVKEEANDITLGSKETSRMTEPVLSSVPALHPASKKNYIAVRVMYAMAPKRTRRRGVKPGAMYLVLTAPPIPKAAVVAPPKGPNENFGEGEPGGGENRAEATTADNNNASSPPPKVDYSRHVAQRRVMLIRCQQALDAVARDTQQPWQACGLVVEESRNAKTWKSSTSTANSVGGGPRRDRLEGTVEESEDYQAFFKTAQETAEELKARPKPAPGGGAATVAAAAGTSTAAGVGAGGVAENGQPVAAIVMHLRAAQEEAKNRKKAKRKAKEAGTANVKAIQGKSKEKINSAANGKNDAAKKKKLRKRKKKEKAAAAASASGATAASKS